MKMRFSVVLAAAVLLACLNTACAVVPPAEQKIQQPLPECPKPLQESRLKEALPELKHTHTTSCAQLNRDKLHIVCILDRSGSMHHLTGDTIGGYNSFIERQRAGAPESSVTTVLFDNKYEVLYENRPIKDVPELTEREYFTRGTTALLDAVGATILRLDGSFKKDKVCPLSEPVIFMIMTDGLENASREFSRSAVKKLVSDAQEKYGWKFIFMGANIDSVAEAGSLGIRREAAMDYAADSAGVGAAYESAGAAMKMFRAQEKLNDSWKKAPAPKK